MLYYWYQPLIAINKREIQRCIIQCCIITEQLLHEAEYDMKSYADRGAYLPEPKAWAWWITPYEICISLYHTKAEFNNCLINIQNIYTAKQNGNWK